MLKVIWNDPVWSKVIAAGILALVAALTTYLLNWWPKIGGYISNSCMIIKSYSVVPNWLLGILGLLAIPTILLIIALIYSLLNPTPQKTPDWKTYTNDTLFEIRWRWKYFNNAISDMHTFCPHCDFQIYPQNASGFNAIDRITFYCDSCHKSLASFDEPYFSLENKAKRFAEQRIRNGSWSNKIVP